MHRPWLKVTITEKTTVGREVKRLSIFMEEGVHMAVVFLGFVVTLVSLFVAERI